MEKGENVENSPIFAFFHFLFLYFRAENLQISQECTKFADQILIYK